MSGLEKNNLRSNGNPETSNSDGRDFSRPINQKPPQENLREWYRIECDKERISILNDGFMEWELDKILSELDGQGLFALALAGNYLRARRKMEARLN